MNVTNTEICTYSRMGQGACGVSLYFSYERNFFLICDNLRFKGDSGGPLTIGDGEEVVGIVSYGTIVCAMGRPDVYTRVSEFVDWITENCAD